MNAKLIELLLRAYECLQAEDQIFGTNNPFLMDMDTWRDIVKADLVDCIPFDVTVQTKKI